ncbi:MAG: hypothetical protein JWN61_1323 [Pseudonocardiales bacterium]|nr:hypothetical protein [Pseudonocardiales bacterium]
MDASANAAPIGEFGIGAHVCWVVDDAAGYTADAAALLEHGVRLGQRPIAFGPEHSAALAELDLEGLIRLDPYVAVLDGGSLDADTMLAMFREQSALAKSQGFSGLRVVADMDWTRPAQAGTASIVAFESLLDRLVHVLAATVVCAYRRSSFDADAVDAFLMVHPQQSGRADPPALRFVATGVDAWKLAGELDRAAATMIAAALAAAACAESDCVLDVSELSFVDVAGMRAIADTARAAGARIQLRGATAALRRYWRLAGFDDGLLESSPTEPGRSAATGPTG